MKTVKIDYNTALLNKPAVNVSPIETGLVAHFIVDQEKRMSAYSPASEVILRHIDEFTQRRVLFAGDLQDDLAANFEAAEVRAHCSQYHHWRLLHRSLGDGAQFSLLPSESLVEGCDTLIYYWPKSKQEAQFQLRALLSLLPAGSSVFIVGENRSGVRSAESLFEPFGAINKIDGARRCGLYYARLEQPATFNLDEWWQSYRTGSLTIKTLPGVFSRDALDVGSRLLLETLANVGVAGDVLDIGCGAGVLSAALSRMFGDIRLTLTDVSSAALASSEATLAANGIDGKVFASDVFSDVQGRFDTIISNPPFHDGLQTSLAATESLIRDAKSHLQLGGRLYIVANAFLPYAEMLDSAFGNHEVLAQTGRFKVYQAVFQRPAPRGVGKGKSGGR